MRYRRRRLDGASRPGETRLFSNDCSPFAE
jgi:hypothetical protein